VIQRAALVACFSWVALAQTASQTFRFTYIDTAQARQEVLNSLRSVGEMKDVSADSTGAVTVKGTADQIALAKWLMQALDQPPGPQKQPARSYTLSSDPVPEARVYYTHAPNPQALQQMINSVRSVSDLQRVMPFNATLALVFRGTRDQVALAEWMINGLDRPATQSASVVDYGVPFGMRLESTRIFYLPPAAEQVLVQLMSQVRTQTGLQRLTLCIQPGAMVARGSSDQIAEATRLIQQAKQ
jgi:type II secretory pathway component GspD/PulD (secretin)